jgi:DNA primase
MSLWLVKATWCEDEAEASESWEVNAETAQDAVTAVATHLRFHPHHVEARRYEPNDVDIAIDLSPGEARRIP